MHAQLAESRVAGCLQMPLALFLGCFTYPPCEVSDLKDPAATPQCRGVFRFRQSRRNPGPSRLCLSAGPPVRLMGAVLALVGNEGASSPLSANLSEGHNCETVRAR